ncbi:WD repeat-containing protein 38 [Amblyraja radiata]|uniref:WD repeat-containing protein 38 n=1 Tax=Amblyraja radiata TaxID=386614 RepID=UPI001402D634|nr:WD repeat-containing protein 38 [Amblyraja radiata]
MWRKIATDFNYVSEKHFISHRAQVNHCAFSHDGYFLITGADDCNICTWDIWSGKRLTKAKGHKVLFVLHTGPVKVCVFSGDAKLFASGSTDYTVRVWNTDKATCLHVLKGRQPQCAIESILLCDITAWFGNSFAQELNKIAVLSLVSVAQPITQRHSRSVETVGFSHNSKLLASAGWDRVIILWDPKLGQLMRKFLGHENVIGTCAFSYNDEYLATGSWDFKVIIWGLDSTWRTILHGHKGNVSCVAFSSIGMLASGSWDKTVRVWDSRNGTLIFLLDKHSGHIQALSFSIDAILLMTAAEDGTGVLENVSNCQFSSFETLLVAGTTEETQ